MERYLIYLGLESNDGDKWDYIEALDIIIKVASEIGVMGFTAYQTIGMWRGKTELSIRLELFECWEQLATEYALLLKKAFKQETVGLATDVVRKVQWI
ncbi:MAG: hypothetical protein GX241_08160 [Ruminococcaceae bacterium]|nr:hypothetical protein [Oscillospiraceae bacterium]